LRPDAAQMVERVPGSANPQLVRRFRGQVAGQKKKTDCRKK
jgi:hypothetical protein